jgi:hypothetical protein
LLAPVQPVAALNCSAFSFFPFPFGLMPWQGMFHRPQIPTISY